MTSRKGGNKRGESSKLSGIPSKSTTTINSLEAFADYDTNAPLLSKHTPTCTHAELGEGKETAGREEEEEMSHTEVPPVLPIYLSPT